MLTNGSVLISPLVGAAWLPQAPLEAILVLVATVLIRRGGSALGGSGSD